MAIDITSGLLITRKPEDEIHGNHLRAPLIGIRDLRLKAAGKSSIFHLPENAPDPSTAEAGSESFNFLPEHDTCELVFDIDNPFDIVDRARIEITKRFEKTVLWTLDLVKLGPTWIRHGVHTVKWAGQIIAGTAAIPGTIKDEATEHDLTAEPAKTDSADKAPFPDGWLTLEHTPYKLRLVLESDKLPDHPAEAWTYFHVMLEKIEIKLGPEEAIPNDGSAPTLDQDKAVRKELEDAAKWPKAGNDGKAFLLSNRFKNSDADFAAASNIDFSTYKDMWGDGPRIPLLAKLWMRAADGSEIDLETAAKGAVALGRAKFMWDVADPAEVAKAVDAEAIAFLDLTRDYYKNATDTTRAAKDHTYYEGDNCHIDRGGRRGPDGVTHFPEQAGYAPKATLEAAKFPFEVGAAKVKDTAKRKWAAFSHGWTSGKLKGHTGVLFRPSRMAGDNYIVSVQLAHDWAADGVFTIDVTDKDLKVPAKITAKTGTLEIWRRVWVSRYIRKAGVADFMSSFNSVATYYEQAFVEMKEKIDAADNYMLAAHKKSPADAAPLDFNALCRTKLTALNYDLYNELVIASATEDHATASAVFRVVPYAQFVQNVHEKHFNHPATDFPQQAAAATVTVAQFASGLGSAAPLAMAPGATPPIVAANARATRINGTQTYLKSQGYDTLLAFAKTVEKKLDPASDAVAQAIGAIAGCATSGAAAPAGLTVLHYQYIHSGTQEYVDAGNADHGGVKGTALDADDRQVDKVLFLLTRPYAATFAHECGHHLFLPHPNPPSSAAAALKVHDQADTKCLMSYDPNRHGFCGFCQLRLRGWGWSGFKLDPDGTLNKQP
jgi:hypothetical protein